MKAPVMRLITIALCFIASSAFGDSSCPEQQNIFSEFKSCEEIQRNICRQYEQQLSELNASIEGFNKSNGVEGIGKRLSEADYLKHKSAVLFSLDQAWSILGVMGDVDPEFKKYVISFLKEVEEDRFPITIANNSDGFEAGILSDKTSNPPHAVLILGAHYEERMISDPKLFQSTLLHELRHLYDIQKYGWDSDVVRITSTHESRGLEVQARFLKRTASDSKLPRVRRAIAALHDAPDGPDWRRYISENEGKNFEMSDKLQKQAYALGSEVGAKKAAEIYSQLLAPMAQDLLRQYSKFSPDYWANPKNASQAVAFFRRLHTYNEEAGALHETVLSRVRSPDQAAVRAQGDWAVDSDRLYKIEKALLNDKNLVSLLTKMDLQPATDQKKKQYAADFSRWEKKQRTLQAQKGCVAISQDDKSQRHDCKEPLKYTPQEINAATTLEPIRKPELT